MTTTRQDAWSQDEDLLLAEVVLRHIRDGGTQLAAFEEVGRKLTRTAAACGFRWNSFVRKQYKTGIEVAKKQRKELRKSGPHEPASASEQLQGDVQAVVHERKTLEQLSMEDIIASLKRYESALSFTDLRGENEALKEKCRALEKEISRLEQERQTLLNSLQGIEQDYKALIEIMERARKMVVLQEDERSRKVKFQLDRSSNLESVQK
ncbi:RsfA family transcriptional regulator [Bacillus lacus]|uniref:RsfA family transcriptional regulator n=1 Tax=Metabacillus lacus TaxID=1983721 RepID=A0A7X2IWC3_9BACI|nr:RsfA family transcriptional regulator [Metabacillus lacus]MRX70825.1 RsfA family transcriptional regulator [Metabacillus lacus]